MPYTLPPITINQNQTVSILIPGGLGAVTAIKIGNATPYLLSITQLLSGSDYMQPGELNVYRVPGLTSAIQASALPFVSNQSAPTSVILVTWYLEGESIDGTYPVNFNSLYFNGGNVGIANQLINDNSPSGTQIIEARPTGASTSDVTLDNAGNLSLAGIATLKQGVNIHPTGFPQPSFSISMPDNATLEFIANGLAGPGNFNSIMFWAWENGSAQELFAIGTSNGGATCYVDGNSVLHSAGPVILSSGHQETGTCGILDNVSAGSQFWGESVNFKTVLTNSPTSMTLTAFSSPAPINIATTLVDYQSKNGFAFVAESAAAGLLRWYGTYTTVGNCLLAVDALAGTFDHHCDQCGYVTRAAPLAACQARQGMFLALSYVCPQCGAAEHFNVHLTAADEADPAPQGRGAYATTRGAQATLIRQLMTALGLEVAP